MITLKQKNKKYRKIPMAVLGHHTAAPRLWNKLPLSTRKSALEDIFKKNLKTYLFKEAYDI